MRRLIIAVIVAVLLGLVVGYFAGRWQLEKQWSAPIVMLSGGDTVASAEDDPKPPSGSRVLIAMPIQKARDALASLVAKDPAVVTVGAVGRGDETTELHLTVKNQGKCTMSGFSGVAYGFDADGRPSKLNRQGQHYVAFSTKEKEVKPGSTVHASFPLKHVDNASIALAQVDAVTCSDGSSWRRATQ